MKKNFWKKKSHNAKKSERGTLWDFQPILLQNSKKIEEGTLWGKKFWKKSLTMPKKTERGTIWSRPVWYVARENRKNLFGSVR